MDCRPLVRGRGLKLKINDSEVRSQLSPACTGAWIETQIPFRSHLTTEVARLYGGVD